MTNSPHLTESDRLVEDLGEQFKELVRTNWINLWGCSDGSNGVKGAVSFSVRPTGPQQYSLNSRLAYGLRYTHRAHSKTDYAGANKQIHEHHPALARVA